MTNQDRRWLAWAILVSLPIAGAVACYATWGWPWAVLVAKAVVAIGCCGVVVLAVTWAVCVLTKYDPERYRWGKS